MRIVDLLNENVVRTNLQGTTKTEILNAIIDVASAQDRVVDKDRVREAIFDREKIMSTGVGAGFAIPHAKSDAVSDIVAAFAVTAQPIDYQSLDDQPVRIVFLLVGRENMVGPHIKLLSRISRLMNNEDFRKRLLEAPTPKDILEIFRQEEATHFEA
jgi:fructose PTS system EIIBC or EIIC component